MISLGRTIFAVGYSRNRHWRFQRAILPGRYPRARQRSESGHKIWCDNAYRIPRAICHFFLLLLVGTPGPAWGKNSLKVIETADLSSEHYNKKIAAPKFKKIIDCSVRSARTREVTQHIKASGPTSGSILGSWTGGRSDCANASQEAEKWKRWTWTCRWVNDIQTKFYTEFNNCNGCSRSVAERSSSNGFGIVYGMTWQQFCAKRGINFHLGISWHSCCLRSWPVRSANLRNSQESYSRYQ